MNSCWTVSCGVIVVIHRRDLLMKLRLMIYLESLRFLTIRVLLKDFLFVAVNHERLPKYGPEEVNICTVVDITCQV